MPIDGSLETRQLFFGWRVVWAAFLVAIFVWGAGFYGPPIFLETLRRTRGWPVSTISAAITLHFLLGAAIVARLAALHHRFGLAGTTRIGAVLTACGLMGWALAQEPWQLFLVMPLSGAGWAMTSGAALNAMVSPWFIRRRPAALSMAYNGASMGGVIFSPLWVALIAGLGFPAAAALVAIAMTATLWVIARRYLERDPARMGLAPDGALDGTAPARHAAAAPLASPWRDRRFVTLAATASLGLFAQIGLIAHLFSLLTPSLGETGAGLVMGMTTAGAIGGRTLLGMMLGDTDRRLALATNIVLQACGSAILILAAGGSVPLLLLGCLLFGLGLGNITSLPALIAQAEFMPVDLPRVVALVTAASQASFAFAPALFGLLRAPSGDGSAPLLFGAAAAVQLAAAIMAMLGRQPCLRAGRS
ncbi:MAG TPA: MFS transporter [Aliidongia sp.]|nr:MFS transporter [Aliidongia sp.]